MKSVGHKNVVDVWRRLKTVVIKKSDMGKFIIHLLLLLRLPPLLVQCVRKSTGWWHDGRQGVYVREWRDSTAGWPLNSNHRQRREKRERDQTDRQFCFSFWITTLFYFISYQFDILFFYFFLKGGVESGCGGAIAKNANVRDRMGSGGCAKSLFSSAPFLPHGGWAYFAFTTFFYGSSSRAQGKHTKTKLPRFASSLLNFFPQHSHPSRSVRV